MLRPLLCSWREVDVFAKPIAEEEEVMEVRTLMTACFSQLLQGVFKSHLITLHFSGRIVTQLWVHAQ